MQIKALVVEGQPKEKGKYWMTYLTWDDKAGRPKIEFFAADEFKVKISMRSTRKCLSGLARILPLLALA